MDNKAWMMEELNKRLKAEGGNVSYERMSEIVSELTQIMQSGEIVELTEETAKTAYDFLELAYKSVDDEEKLRLTHKARLIDPDNIIAADREIMLLPLNDYETLTAYEELLERTNSRLEKENFFAPERLGKFGTLKETRPYMVMRSRYIDALVKARRMRKAVAECNDMLHLSETDYSGKRYLLMHLYSFLEEEAAAIELYHAFEEEVTIFHLPLAVMYFRLGQEVRAREYIKSLYRINNGTMEFFEKASKGDFGDFYTLGNVDDFTIGTIAEYYYAFFTFEFLYIAGRAFFEWAYQDLQQLANKPI